MKISKLHINSFRHLENLDFNFTYPEDFHIKEKRGKPLDKICFIGQSATGKTSLLDLIFDNINYSIELETVGGKLSSNYSNLGVNFELRIGSESFSVENQEISYAGKKYEYDNKGGVVLPLIHPNKKKNRFYFKANLISDKNIDIFTKNPVDLIEKHSKQIENIKISDRINRLIKQKYIFNDNVDEVMWLYMINEILDYRKNFTQKMSELIHKGLLADTKKLSQEFQKWQNANPNVLEDFAKKFNLILEKLFLEVDLINTEYSIPIRNKRNEDIIPIHHTSTGTKGLLLSFLPLYKLDTKDSIILMDEPERSLYPDMQMDLMEYYQNLAPESQFIIATHSPFIAASFEPSERFILYFDNDGKVAVKRGSSPIGDDPNDMLKNDFGVNYYNKFGEEAYKKYLKLKEDLAKEKDPIKKKELLLETVKLGDTYNF